MKKQKQEKKEYGFEIRSTVPIEITFSTRGLKLDDGKKGVYVSRDELVELYGSAYFEARVISEDGDVVKDWTSVNKALEYTT